MACLLLTGGRIKGVLLASPEVKSYITVKIIVNQPGMYQVAARSRQSGDEGIEGIAVMVFGKGAVWQIKVV